MVSSKITPLAAAMFTKRFEIAEILLDHGADPLVRVRGGFSAMHEAALLNDVRLVQLLYDHGAELDSRTDQGDTPLDIAISKNRADSTALLRELGARTAEEIEAAKEAHG
jgi:ankyrin repeat protein